MTTSGSRDVYDFVARSYAPDLAAFTQLDSVAGSVQNPLTLNRYLYAAANPETLIDPDGHVACTGHNDSTCDGFATNQTQAQRHTVETQRQKEGLTGLVRAQLV